MLKLTFFNTPFSAMIERALLTTPLYSNTKTDFNDYSPIQPCWHQLFDHARHAKIYFLISPHKLTLFITPFSSCAETDFIYTLLSNYVETGFFDQAPLNPHSYCIYY
jgi:hypothetical protein